jgi:hypothetical protein
MDRRAQLKSLVESLEHLVEVLRLDPGCRWTPHFESSLQRAHELIESGFSQDALSTFSASVMSVYRGAGSFNDYAPAVYDQHTGRCTLIPGTERFEQLSGQVYDEALSLRVIGLVT